jgi:hypothetical protein
MMNIQEKLTQFKALLAEHSLNTEAIIDWLASLPLSELSFTSRLLYKAISRIHKHALSISSCVVLLNLTHRTLQQFSQQYSREYIVHDLANYRKNLSAIYYLDIPQLKFVRASFNLLNNQGKKLNSTEKALLVHRAMSEIGLLLLRRAQLYLAPPKGAWSLLHGLYRYATGQQLLTSAVTEVSLQGVTHTTIAQLYKRILLLALADTAHLSQQDMEKLYLSANAWVDKFYLEPAHPQQYKICFDTDLPPFHYTSSEKVEGKVCCYIQLDELVKHLQQLLITQLATQGKIKQGLTDHVLAYLIRLWTSRPARRFERNDEMGTAEICIGLATMHYMVNEQNDLVVEGAPDLAKAMTQTTGLSFQKPTVSSILIPGELNNLAEEPDVWQIHQAALAQEDAINRKNALVNSHPIYHWQIINSSAKGYCLGIVDQVPELLQVGKVVGVKTNQAWYVAVIRWLQYNSSKGYLLAGVELLAPQASGVALQKATQSQKFHGLLLPEVVVSNQAASLITPALIYKVGEKLTVQELAHTYQVKLTKLLVENHNYAQYEFNVVNQ